MKIPLLLAISVILNYTPHKITYQAVSQKIHASTTVWARSLKTMKKSTHTTQLDSASFLVWHSNFHTIILSISTISNILGISLDFWDLLEVHRIMTKKWIFYYDSTIKRFFKIIKSAFARYILSEELLLTTPFTKMWCCGGNLENIDKGYKAKIG